MHGNGLITVAIVLGILAFVDWYAFQGLKTLIRDWDSRALKQAVYVLFWAIHTASISFVVYGMMNMGRNHGMNTLGAIGFNVILTLFFTQLVFILFLFAEDIYRVISGIVSAIQGETKPGYLPERRKFISQLALLVASVPFISFVYGITKGKYNYKIHKHVLSFKDLPEAFDGFTITQISDVHSGSFDNKEAVEYGIELINEQKSDLFLFTGDLVNNDPSEFRPWKEIFSKIKAPFGQFSVLGNHDYGDYAEWPSVEAKQKDHNELLQHHADVGFRLMLDEHVKLEKGDSSTTLIGVHNWGHGFKQVGDLESALAGVEKDSFKILMSHDPTHFEHQVKNHPANIHLTLSGHTHGMQMGVEFPWLKWSPVKYRYPKWAGLYEENGRFLNVNRGFGFIGFSGRVGIWPEITVIELRKA